MEISNKEAIKGKDVSFDKELCLGPKGVPQEKDGVDGLTGDDTGVSIASSCQWSATDYEWKDGYSTCTATKTCSNNVDHKGTKEGKVTSHYEKPTKDEPGKTVYTATFEDKVFDDQTAEVENPSDPALGYDLYVWGDPVTAENQGDVRGDKTVTYDPVQNILKLNVFTAEVQFNKIFFDRHIFQPEYKSQMCSFYNIFISLPPFFKRLILFYIIPRYISLAVVFF
jgi:hypothetical protein